jgi:membrane protein implicated in regulation of membrane protease activity
MKIASIAALGLTTLWVVIALLQLWFDIVSGSVFVKLTVTFAIIIGLVVLVALVYREYVHERSLKEKGFID